MPINSDPLFRKLGFDSLPWIDLLARFTTDREEWREILSCADMTREIETAKRTYTAQSITRRMVEHETCHLEVISTEL